MVQGSHYRLSCRVGAQDHPQRPLLEPLCIRVFRKMARPLCLLVRGHCKSGDSSFLRQQPHVLPAGLSRDGMACGVSGLLPRCDNPFTVEIAMLCSMDKV